MPITPQDLQKLLDEREASRASRKRAWENLQEIRWVLKDIAGIDLPPPARKTIDLEGRLVKDGVRTALRDRQEALSELVEAIRKYRKLAEKTPLTLQGSDFAQCCRGAEQGDWPGGRIDLALMIVRRDMVPQKLQAYPSYGLGTSSRQGGAARQGTKQPANSVRGLRAQSGGSHRDSPGSFRAVLFHSTVF
jgi:hypothetical protein